MMHILFFSENLDIIDEWKNRHAVEESISCFDEESLLLNITKFRDAIVIADFDTVSTQINRMISSNSLPKRTIVLEQVPEIVTGKSLISHAIKAYGNSRMLNIHFKQMIETVNSTKVWTYPELTIALADSQKSDVLSLESKTLLENRLTPKEKEVVFCILNGLSNEAIAHKKGITTRTVKAHISSLFSKLHVNDRLALVLLLK
ncbi:MAG: helix-turn-helix transcriptional regulator [Campylobacterota bacterium]|nr:helix-turn-helix transcriptional regulator [Campylobacterota bacterium]